MQEVPCMCAGWREAGRNEGKNDGQTIYQTDVRFLGS